MKLVECVPNFSEGKDRDKINSITREIESTQGVKLLDVDPGESTNRTVVTFIGTPNGIKEAAFKAIKKASEVIDMRSHKGAHSRIGATDVCPFVPVSGVTMEDCIQIAREVAGRVARELAIPVYLYEEAAQKPERKNLANIRAGEYEGLEEKLHDPVWAPDFGEAVFNPKSGATVIGAREFLIAYNINLNTREKKLASEIALNLRESGRVKRDPEGNILRDAAGNTLKIPGRFRDVKAVGWYIEDYGVAQISINFTNYKVSPPHLVFDETVKEAEKLGLRVTGSELVGLIPKEALLMAGRYYLEKQGKNPGVPEDELIHTAVLSLGLNDVVRFDPQKKIIENQFGEEGPSLLRLNLRQFVNEVSLDSPTPGGGSVAALCGALSAALSAMVANLTYGKRGYENTFEEMKTNATKAQSLKDELLRAVDLDTQAFNKVMEAYRLPKTTEDQKKEKERAVEEALKEATLVPLEVLKKSLELLDLARTVAVNGNKNSLSDAGVAGSTAQAAAEGAYFNVRINLPNIRDKKFKTLVKKEALSFKRRVSQAARGLKDLVEKDFLGQEKVQP
jgi:glutamate formiminotransferase/formiminotetrahydrofolate cyclodeaminase